MIIALVEFLPRCHLIANNFTQQRTIIALGELHLLVQACEYACLGRLEEIDEVLIVGRDDALTVDALGLVDLLLALEYIVEEVLLQLLIGKVDR